MKKKVITMMMALTMALSTAGFSYASTTAGSTCTKNVSTEVSVKCAEKVKELCSNSQVSAWLDKICSSNGNIGNTGNAGNGGNAGSTGSENSGNTENSGNANDSATGSVVSGSMTSQVVTLVNKERASNGLQSLTSDSQLAKLAQMKAEDMAKNGYFSHTSPTYGSAFDMMKTYGVSYKTAGENIAKGQKTAEAVMNGWMNSSGHRANILKSDYTKIGVGYAKASDGTTYWVQIFKG